ncbi:MAG: lipase family protein, partial [Spirochaeta sp.]|nr:lipase family protein [Spirochaeta sp.]
LAILASCSSGPAALGLKDVSVQGSRGTAALGAGDTTPSIEQLLEHYDMCLAAWRVRENYRDYPWAMQYFEHVESNTLGFTMVHEGRMYIVFRGSQPEISEIDRRINFQISRVRMEHLREYGKLRAHYGFLSKYAAVRTELLSRVAATRQSLPVTVVGHSQGGAMASLTFFELALLYPDRDVRAVTFGMPRIYNHAAAELQRELNNRHTRVVNGRDLVARLPLRSWGFHHVGTKLHIGHRGFPWTPAFSDHYPGYRETLENILEEHHARNIK